MFVETGLLFGALAVLEPRVGSNPEIPLWPPKCLRIKDLGHHCHQVLGLKTCDTTTGSIFCFVFGFILILFCLSQGLGLLRLAFPYPYPKRFSPVGLFVCLFVPFFLVLPPER